MKKSNFGPNLTFWPRPQGVKSLFRKSENVTFLQLCCSNFVQNIIKFWSAYPQISALRTNRQTDRRTDEAEFIGPFRLKPWAQLLIRNSLLHSKLLYSFKVTLHSFPPCYLSASGFYIRVLLERNFGIDDEGV